MEKIKNEVTVFCNFFGSADLFVFVLFALIVCTVHLFEFFIAVLLANFIK